MLFLRMLPLVLPQAIITNDFAALNLIYVWFVLDCSNPTPLNGIVSLPNGNTYGSVAMVSCNSGYKLYGDALIRCQLNSSWSSTPSCIKGKNTRTHTHTQWNNVISNKTRALITWYWAILKTVIIQTIEIFLQIVEIPLHQMGMQIQQTAHC